MERIRFITHQGKEILLVDLSNCSAKEVERIARSVPTHVTTQARGSVLLLADLTGASFDREAIRSMKESAVFDKPHIKKTAWIGADSLPHVYQDGLRTFSRRSFPTFRSREEALDWLVTE
ncbi:MAG: hypothetical protein JOZ36_01500 [Acidobacteria bacterium]|nr:hypothetical protein [Acidobacteriota bacterium]